VIGFSLDELLIMPFLVPGVVLGVLAFSGHKSEYLSGLLLFASSSGLAFGVVVSFYNRCIMMGLTGQSWGKKVTDTKLVSVKDGAPIGVANAIVRDMAHTADLVLAGIGIVMPLWDGRRQSISDKLVGAVVVEAKTAEGSEMPRLH
jgi:uncharacterized RDD family membrane protein YckC